MTITVVREKLKVRLVLVIPTGITATLISEIIDTPSLIVLKSIKTLSMPSNTVRYLLNFLLHDYL